MKVYKVHWHDPDNGCELRWYGSKAEATGALKAVLKSYEDASDAEPSGITAQDVPTDKAGLLLWLNVNLRTDNG